MSASFKPVAYTIEESERVKNVSILSWMVKIKSGVCRRSYTWPAMLLVILAE